MGSETLPGCGHVHDWTIVEVYDDIDGRCRELLRFDDLEFLHWTASTCDEVDARVEKIRFDHIVDHLLGDRG